MELEEAAKVLAVETKRSISLSAGCGLFLRFVTRTSMDVTVRLHLEHSAALITFVPGFSRVEREDY